MITDFKIFEKSILTQLGVPDKLMKTLQKSFQFKYEMPKKIENPTKFKIKKLLSEATVFIFMINKETDTYILIYRDGWLPGLNHPKYRTYYYDGNCVMNYLKSTSNGISKTMKDIVITGFDIYTINRKGFKGYRMPHNLEKRKVKKLKKQKIKDFVKYFNENTVNIMNKINAKRWDELVQAIQTYYLDITKSIDTFVNRHGELPKWPSDREKKKVSDFKDMAYTLQNFADKINDDGSYKLTRGSGYRDNGFLGEEYYKDIKNFLKTRNDFKLDDKEDNEDMLARAIDEYGYMKLSTLFGRFIMSTLIDWLREKIGYYTGLDKEMDKYNL